MVLRNEIVICFGHQNSLAGNGPPSPIRKPSHVMVDYPLHVRLPEGSSSENDEGGCPKACLADGFNDE